eukprot:Lankesteria_metandrocarpae@DN2951_c1_g1_i1.p1
MPFSDKPSSAVTTKNVAPDIYGNKSSIQHTSTSATTTTTNNNNSPTMYPIKFPDDHLPDVFDDQSATNELRSSVRRAGRRDSNRSDEEALVWAYTMHTTIGDKQKEWNYASDKSLWRRIRVFVLKLSSGEGTWKDLDNHVSLVPMTFRSKDLELNYKTTFVQKALINDSVHAGSIGLALSLLIWVIFGFLMSIGLLGSLSVVDIVLFHVFYCSICGLYLSLALLRRWNCTCLFIEWHIYGVALLVFTFGFIWTTTTILTLHGRAHLAAPFTEEERKAFLSLRIWIYQPSTLSDYFLFLSLGVVCRGRTKMTSWIHMYAMVLKSANFAAFVELYLPVFRGDEGIMCVEYLMYCVLAVCALCTRFVMEMTNRRNFLGRVRQEMLLLETKRRLNNRTRKKHAVVFERLLQHLINARLLMHSIMLTSQYEESHEARDHLNHAIDILESHDIYALDVIDGSGVDEGAADAIDAFVRFYRPPGSRKFATTWTTGSGRNVYNQPSTPFSTFSSKFSQESGDAESTPFAAGHFKPSQLELTSFLADKIGREWNAPILQYADRTGNILVECGASLLQPYIGDLGVTMETVCNLLYSMQELYFPNPYHNATHGAAVAHFTYCLGSMFSLFDSELMSNADIVGVVLAGLGHDLSHPARNNAFLTNASEALAIVYNDSSVLENFHCSLLFSLLHKPNHDIFRNVNLEQYRATRSHIVNLILGTDMKLHFESVSRFRVRASAKDFDPLMNDNDLWLMFKMSIKMADLAHTCLDWDQHLNWSLRVVEEFYQQGEAELELGLPKSPLCDRDTHATFAKGQSGFIQFVIQPFAEELNTIPSNGHFDVQCCKRIQMTKAKWDDICAAGAVVPIPERIHAMKTGMRLSHEATVTCARSLVKRLKIEYGAKDTSCQTDITLKGMETVAATLKFAMGDTYSDLPSSDDWLSSNSEGNDTVSEWSGADDNCVDPENHSGDRNKSKSGLIDVGGKAKATRKRRPSLREKLAGVASSGGTSPVRVSHVAGGGDADHSAASRLTNVLNRIDKKMNAK